MFLEFIHPIPVITPIGDGMAIYVRDGGTFNNDIWAVALEDGRIRHFRSDQILMERNTTFNIQPPKVIP
jgi:hypothetical protein